MGYGFALNGRTLCVSEFLSLIEVFATEDVWQLWTFVLTDEESVVIHCGINNKFVAKVKDQTIEFSGVKNEDLFCWFPHILRYSINTNFPDLTVFVNEKEIPLDLLDRV